jgi:Tfp pilus assembly protein PilZ
VNNNIYNYGYRAPRFRADFRLLLQARDRNPVLLDARCSQISEDGLAAETNAVLEIGERVLIIMTLPGTPTSIRIAASVTNRQISNYGLAFIFSSQNERNHMRAYLESRRSGEARSPELSE